MNHPSSTTSFTLENSRLTKKQSPVFCRAILTNFKPAKATKSKNQMERKTTFTRTLCQFTQYGDVIRKIYVGNKLQAMNAVKFAYGVKHFSVLHEYTDKQALKEGTILSN
jgi:hypothetical protein